MEHDLDDNWSILWGLNEPPDIEIPEPTARMLPGGLQTRIEGLCHPNPFKTHGRRDRDRSHR